MGSPAQERAMHFGLYLKKKGIISSDQLVAALEEQVNTLVPIGQLALEEGVLSARDIFTVLHAQSDSPAERFGELAIEMGMLSRDQLTHLLMVQADRRRTIAEILVSQGAVSEMAMAAEMAAFRRVLLGRERTAPRYTTYTVTPPPRRPEASRETSDELITV
jgi:hypothetical protein